MAATSAAFATISGSAAAASAPGRHASRLSSGNAFRTTSIVQFVPFRSQRSNRVIAARAALSEDSKAIQRDVIVSILAAGAALGFSASAVEGAFANPIDAAASKATTTLNSAKNAPPTLPSAPNPGGAIEDTKKGAENIASDFKGQIDGIFAKGRPGPLSKSSNSVASTNGGTGSALGDAEKRFSSFGKNPIADNIEEGSKKMAGNIARASPKPNSQKVDEATQKVGRLGEDLQNKGSDIIAEGKNFITEKTQGSVPSLPDLFPKIPETPGLPTLDTSKFKDLKSGVQSKVEEAKGAAESVLPQ